MIKVTAVKDESSHWYIIPTEKKERFNFLQELLTNSSHETEGEEEYNINRFEDEFGKYRTGGDLNNVQLYAEI